MSDLVACPFCEASNPPTADACFDCGRNLFSLTRGALLSGRYEILGLLGRGGMGTVYKANDRELDEVVAIKVLRAELANSADAAKRFRSEIKLARKVRHENVCGIHEYGQQGHLRYIVMECVEGVDLKQILREQGRLDPDEAYEISIRVAAGLQAIHSVGIVHRDLKTPNVMRDSHGRIRLMDFGIAKQMVGDTTGATATGHIVGTPEYMSPEQARGEKVDVRSDLYALGIMVYELFTGDVPFRGDTPVATLMKHLTAELPLEGPQALGLPPALIPILRRALAKDREDRFASGREFGEALSAARGTPSPMRTLAASTPVRGANLGPAPAIGPDTPTTPAGPVTPVTPPASGLALRGARSAGAPPRALLAGTTQAARPTLVEDFDDAVAPASQDPPTVPVSRLSAGEPARPGTAVPTVPAAGISSAAASRASRAASRPDGYEAPRSRTRSGRAMAMASVVVGVVAATGWWLASPAAPTPTETTAPLATSGWPAAAEPSIAMPTPVPEEVVTVPPRSVSDPPPPTPVPKREARPATRATPPGRVAAAPDVAPFPTPVPVPVEPVPIATATPEPVPRAAQETHAASPPTVAAPRILPSSAPLAVTPRLGKGSLIIKAKPWATVELDGRSAGRTPLTFDGIPEGEHVVVFTHPDYQPLRRFVRVWAGKPFTLQVDMRDEAFKK